MTPSRKINYLEALWRRKWLVLPFVLLGSAAGFGAFTQMTPFYRASAVISYVPQTLSNSIMPDPAESRRAAPNRVQEMRGYIDHVDFVERVAGQAVDLGAERQDVGHRGALDIDHGQRVGFLHRDPGGPGVVG